jgi:threonine dehydrogenase-like Zn-dependent dehydrogenase
MGHAQGWGKMDFYPGAYSEYCLGWAGLLYPIPDHVSYVEAAMADILCVAVHVVGRTNIYEGANVLCFGGGPAGLGIAQVAKTKGAKNIFISDPSPLAREVIAKYKDLIIIDPGKESVPEVIAKHVGNEKCIAIFDSVGSNEQINIGLPLLEEQGTYVNMAVHDEPLDFNAQLLGSERTMTTSSNAFYKDVEKAYQLIESGVIDVKPWITHRLPLEEYEKAFDLLLQEPKAAYKVVFEPWKNKDQ